MTMRRSTLTTLLFSLTSLLLFSAPGDLGATTRTVTSPADTGPGSLRTVISDAEAGDTIRFGRATDGVPIILLTGSIAIDLNLVIIGLDTASTIIDGNGLDRIFDVTADSLVLQTLRLTGGSSDSVGGAIRAVGTQLSIVRSVLDNNRAAVNGGAIHMTDGFLYVERTMLRGNVAAGDSATMGGGAIYNEGALVSLRDSCRITLNMATGAGGSGGAIFNADEGTLIIDDCTLASNTAVRAGGAIEDRSGSAGEVRISASRLDSNTASASPGNGGALHVTGAADISIVGSLVRNNVAASEGGGLWNGLGTMSISSTTISGNSASGNAADNGGGGIYNLGGMVRIDRNTMILNNQALGTAGSGGGILNDGEGQLMVSSSTIMRNRANRAGGGIENNSPDDSAVVLRDVTLDTNRAAMGPGNGGGLHITGSGGSYISDTRVRGNSALSEGGGLWNGSGRMRISASRVDGNVASGAAADNGGGGIYNLSGMVTITGETSIQRNIADGTSGSGGGILNDMGGTLTIDSAFIRLNVARRAGGGIEDNSGRGRGVIMTNTSLEMNTAGNNPGNGGGLHVTGPGDVLIGNVEIRGNLARREGGGLWNGSGTMTITGSTLIVDNAARGAAPTQGGGGIFNNGGTLNIQGLTEIRRNRADSGSGSGGGILNGPGGVLRLSGTVIVANRANRAGGGIEDNSGAGSTVQMTRVTLDSNTTGAAPGNGGGLHITGAGSATIEASRVRDNSAASEGGGLWNGAGMMSVTTTTISGNSAGGNAADQGGGGIYNLRGMLTISDSRISGNMATGTSGSGGGILNDSGAALTISNTSIALNSAMRAGGGIEENSKVSTPITLTNVRLDSNTASANPGNGGGLHVTGNGGVTITGGSVTGNLAAAEGGGLWNGTGEMVVNATRIQGNTAGGNDPDQGGGGLYNLRGVMTLENNVMVTDNSATGTSGSGGGILNDSGATLYVRGATISANSASRAGGGIEDNSRGGTSLELTDVTMERNSTGSNPGNGGALHVTGDGTVSMIRGIVRNNTATREGGGLWNGSGMMTVIESTVSNNLAEGAAADDGGGGIFNNGGTLTIGRSTLAGNRSTGAASLGGGLHVNGGSARVTLTTFSGNSAAGGGGGIATTGGLDLTTSTVTANSTAGSGGGLIAVISSAPVTISSSIIAANMATGGSNDVAASGGTITSAGYNLIGIDGSGVIASTANDVVGSGTPIDPMLDTLANNGGSTRTHALICGSPAINTGDPTLTGMDQRGRPVFQQIRDIGAFELQIDCGPGAVAGEAGRTISRVAPTTITEESFAIELPEEFAGETRLGVSDLSGATVVIRLLPGPGRHRVELPALPTGTYIVTLENGERNENHRIVIIR